MFKKIRLRLTLLSGGITTIILVIMTLGYLFISEKNLMQTRILSAHNDVYTIAYNLEQNDMLSYTWLSQLESGGGYYISVLDNGHPFLYNNKNNVKPKYDTPVSKIWEYYHKNSGTMGKSTLSYLSSYKSFQYDKNYCFVISYEKEKSVLEILIVMPVSNIRGQILRQRFLFLSIISAALAAIWIFSYFFTGRLLRPIEENRIKQNEFVAAASHELRTPLAVILSYAELPDENSHSMGIIKNEALRMSALVEDMLMLCQSDADRFDIEKSPTELDTLVLNAGEAFEAMANAKKIRLTFSLPDNALPKCECDKKRIGQVIAILLHNAISYTPENGCIALSLSMRARDFAITVSDTGVGIPDDEKKRIFERFYRCEKSRSVKGHFGLGLSIAYEIVRAHYGRIEVSDTAGGGAAFTVYLPL